MRSFSRVLLIPAILLPLLTACGEATVMPQHVHMATEKCEANGGWSRIDQAHVAPEFENCGARCTRRLSTSQYAAAVSCKNGAKFDLTWQE
jgi:hypothetical protein